MYEDIALIPRSSWDETYMTIAVVYAMRSPDPSTKHGCVVVSGDNRPVGFGYNGFPKGSADNSRYPTTRPEKYRFIPHSELNALLNRTLNTEGGIVYVTGKPCSGCISSIIQGGIKKVIFGEIGSHCVDPEDWEATLLMADNCGIELVSYADNNPIDIFDRAASYLHLKGWSNGSQAS